MELLCSRASASRLSEYLLFYSILSARHLYPYELEYVHFTQPLMVQNMPQQTFQVSPAGATHDTFFMQYFYSCHFLNLYENVKLAHNAHMLNLEIEGVR